MIDISDRIKVERVSPYNVNSFFGYYDISPESPNGKNILFNIPPFNDRMPLYDDYLKIVYLNEKGEQNEIASTTAWNFQEGCRAQWIDNNNIIYNTIINESVQSEIYNLNENRVEKKYNKPIYSINNITKKATSYNMYRCRYCYPHEKKMEETDYDHDGIFIIDLSNGVSKLLISISSLADSVQAKPEKTWVEHVVFNSCGDSFFFFHRWEPEGGGFLSRFCVSDLQGNVTVLLDSGMCSHAGWLGNDKITAWARMPSMVSNVQKNEFIQRSGIWRHAVGIYHILVKQPKLRQAFTNEAYLIFDTKQNGLKKITNKEFVSDGHETWSTNMRWMLTDTYPNKNNMRSLLLYDSENDLLYLLGEFYSHPRINSNLYSTIPGIRCDLHPKWSYLEKYIYFDSTHEGFRGLYRVDISKLMI